MGITAASQARVERFIHDFIRSHYVAEWTAEKDSDFINEPERAARCHDSAEHGADGKTHAEVIEDWREAFDAYVYHKNLERFTAAVHAHFDAVEAWHEKNGSLHQEIG